MSFLASPISTSFLMMGRISALVIILATPWYYGSSGWTAQVWCVVASTICLLCALLGANWRKAPSPSFLCWCLAALMLIALLQTVPLPRPLWSLLSPNADFEAEVDALAVEISDLPLANLEPDKLGPIPYPQTISTFPTQTLATTVVLGSALSMLLSGGILFGNRRWQVVLLSTIALVGLSNALLGLFQTIVWNKWTLIDMPTSTYYSTFFCRNSAPQYYSLAIGATLALMFGWNKERRLHASEKRYHVRYPAVNLLARLRRRVEDQLAHLDLPTMLCLITTTLLMTAVMTAASRGGILACVMAFLVTILVTLATQRSGIQITLGLVIGSALCMLFLTSFDMDSAILDRLGTIDREAYALDNGRFQLWAMTLSRTCYWLLGSGYGTFHLAILPCYPLSNLPWFYHAENIYLEVFTTLGVLGLVVCIAGLVWLVKKLVDVKYNSRGIMFAATLLPLTAIGLQSLVDFSLILPSIFLPLAIVVSSFVAETQAPRHPHRDARRSHKSRIRKQQLEKAATEKSPEKKASSADRKSSLRFTALGMHLILSSLIVITSLCGASELLRLSQAETMILAAGNHGLVCITPQFELARQAQEQYSAAMLESANWPTELGQNERETMARPEMLAAAIRSGDTKFELLVELAESLPDSLHNLRESAKEMSNTVAACPQDWRASWGLLRSDLNTLSKQERTQNAARLLLTARHNPRILQGAGNHFLWSGEKKLGLAFWKAAVRADSNSVNTLIQLVGPLISFDDLLDVLPVSPLSYIRIAKQFLTKQIKSDEAAKLLTETSLESAANEASRTDDWLQVAWLANYQGNREAELNAYSTAARLAPLNHQISFELAKALFAAGRNEEALQEIERADRRSPHTHAYEVLQAEITEAMR